VTGVAAVAAGRLDVRSALALLTPPHIQSRLHVIAVLDDEEERRPASSKNPRMEARQYRLVLHDDTLLHEYDGDEAFTFSYLRTRFKSDAAAQQVLDEVKRDGTAARQFESPSGNMTRVVISLR
jgi:hypothetical protein